MRIRKRPPLCSSVPTPPPPSDLHLRRSEPPPPEQTKRWDFPSYEEKMKLKEFGDDEGVMMNSNNDIRKIVSICHGQESFNTNNMLHRSSSSLQPEEDHDYKLVPLKKRKGNFERISTNEESKKMKSKTNKKYGGEAVMEDGSVKNRKKNKRGNVIMEGSRCSRVNGRGWRCCQPTLVGYSLCEHHLGKGRLRIAQQPSKKRSKVGVVKARSMSSLLSQI